MARDDYMEAPSKICRHCALSTVRLGRYYCQKHKVTVDDEDCCEDYE